MSSDLDRLIGIPEGARGDLERLLAESPASLADLRGEVETHVHLLLSAAATHAQVSEDLARRLGEVSLALLDGLGPEPTPTDRRLVQAAVRYFELDADADGDFDSPEGLEDDRLILNAVCKALGRNELVGS